ncbi:CKLF-like MARVEL transmembrane domain-containing protein 4 [Orchesella cincta]|uniref:CKLF-like MARVEL transmembrane domain-containing protein 4 n=1 Tax=Orchesella cincta TaxID=48709 RepID=A0A1D2NCS8_ORCCI|nr:CKLF-like MARVEL transmembrane domain-containing protein 4 [Orchesella cincta]
MHPTMEAGRSAQPGSSHHHMAGKIMAGSSSTMSSLHLDPHYIVTFGGFLKIMQILFSILGLICILCASRTYYWYGFVALGALFITLILFAFYICRVIERLHFALWIFEAIYCGIWAFLYFIVATYAANSGQHEGVFIAASVFGFLAMIMYVLDVVHKIFLAASRDSRQM